jgi:hypothetical protein
MAEHGPGRAGRRTRFRRVLVATHSTIACTGPSQPIGSLPGPETDGSSTGASLVSGTYQCTITIVDP